MVNFRNVRIFFCALTFTMNAQVLCVYAKEAKLSIIETGCPSQDPKEFLNLFTDNVFIQKKFTRFPLKYYYLDIVLLQNVTKLFSSYESYPYKWDDGRIFPGIDQRKKDNLTDMNIKIKSGYFLVQISDPSNSYGFDYYFKKYGKCWNLYKIFNAAS